MNGIKKNKMVLSFARVADNPRHGMVTRPRIVPRLFGEGNRETRYRRSSHHRTNDGQRSRSIDSVECGQSRDTLQGLSQ